MRLVAILDFMDKPEVELANQKKYIPLSPSIVPSVCRWNFSIILYSFRDMREQHTDGQTYRQTEPKYYIR